MLSESYLIELIKEKGYYLLGEIPVSDEEYRELLEFSRIYAKNVSPSTGIKMSLRLSLTLVQVALREYKEGKFWGYFCDAIGEQLPASKTNFCGKIFSATVRHFGLLYVDRESSNSQMYVENIKLHALVTNYYMQGFWEFLYSYYEKNMFRQIPENLTEDIELLSEFMRQTLVSNADSFVGEESGGKASKSYKLLKSTRTLFANGDTYKIGTILRPQLEMIDAYYYDSVIPDNDDRFKDSFREWCREKEKHDASATKRKRNRGPISRRPYINIDFSSMVSYLCIPAQKFREAEFDGEAEASVLIGGHEETFDLEVYKSFGIYISEEKRIPIPSVFDAIEITVSSNAVKKYRIKSSDYRIINENYDTLNKLVKGKNYLVVKNDIKVVFENSDNCVDKTNEYAAFDFYSTMIDEDSVIHIGSGTLSIAGEYSEEPYYEEEILEYEVIDYEGKVLTVTRTHPTISFLVDKEKLSGSVIIINGIKYPVIKLKNKTVCSTIYSGRVAVVITLEDEIHNLDGVFDVTIDVPGESNKNMCKYVRLSKLDIDCNKSIYTSTDDLFIQVHNGDGNVWPMREDVELVGVTEVSDTYHAAINGDEDFIDFNLELNEMLIVRVRLSLFKAGFSAQEMVFKKPDYIWYSDLQETVYCSALGLEAVRVHLNHDKDNYISGISMGGGVFRIDISKIKEQVCCNSFDGWAYINVTCYGKRKRSFVLYSILRVLWVDPYFDFTRIDGELCFNLKVHGNAQLVVDIEDDRSKEKIIVGREIVNGVTNLPELNVNGVYNIFPKMIEGDEFGFSTNEVPMRCIYGQSYVGTDDLTSYRLQIADLLVSDERLVLSYDYFIDVREKVSDRTFEGTMFGLRKAPRTRGEGKPKGRYELGEDNKPIKKRFGKVRIELIEEDSKSILIQLWSSTYEEDAEEWIELYYDTAFKTLLHSNDNVLSKATDYDRFLFLAAESTKYRLMKKKIRRLLQI